MFMILTVHKFYLNLVMLNLDTWLVAFWLEEVQDTTLSRMNLLLQEQIDTNNSLT